LLKSKVKFARPSKEILIFLNILLRGEGLVSGFSSFFAVAGCWMLDTGCWMLDTGYWMLDAGYWMLDTGFWMLDTGYWILDTGYWILLWSIFRKLCQEFN
jgi:hypothetical protein